MSVVLNEPDNQLPLLNGDVNRLPSGKSDFFQLVALEMHTDNGPAGKTGVQG
ncbi:MULTISPECIES: hypothetical protein [Photorhabdus]|uniref:hypothetical protein n=1 Tax=Photorhabdus TaxID=29487 RepID=UPI000A507DC0|nr:hypothetical protein [Photorhabdus luminescens]